MLYFILHLHEGIGNFHNWMRWGKNDMRQTAINKGVCSYMCWAVVWACYCFRIWWLAGNLFPHSSRSEICMFWGSCYAKYSSFKFIKPQMQGTLLCTWGIVRRELCSKYWNQLRRLKLGKLRGDIREGQNY